MAKWNRCTGPFVVLEFLIGLLLATLGVIFERNRAGILFTNYQQERFSHLVLSYGCLLLLMSLGGTCVLTTFRFFLLLSSFESILAVISIAWGVLVALKPVSVLQHGFIETYLKVTISSDTDLPVLEKSWMKFIFCSVAVIHGLGLLIHAIATFIKHRKVKPHFHELKKQAMVLQGDHDHRGGYNTRPNNVSSISIDTTKCGMLQHSGKDLDRNDQKKAKQKRDPSMSMRRSRSQNNDDINDDTDDIRGKIDESAVKITPPLKGSRQKFSENAFSQKELGNEKEINLDDEDDRFSFQNFNPTTSTTTTVAPTPSIAHD